MRKDNKGCMYVCTLTHLFIFGKWFRVELMIPFPALSWPFFFRRVSHIRVSTLWYSSFPIQTLTASSKALTIAKFQRHVSQYCWTQRLSFILHVFFLIKKLVKGPSLQRQNYYPTPPTSVVPNTPNRDSSLAVTPRTANALCNVQRSYWQTHYQQQFTGNGPQNILKLDNFDEICSGEDDSLVSLRW